jgi:hypothetical protein
VLSYDKTMAIYMVVSILHAGLGMTSLIYSMVNILTLGRLAHETKLHKTSKLSAGMHNYSGNYSVGILNSQSLKLKF